MEYEFTVYQNNKKVAGFNLWIDAQYYMDRVVQTFPDLKFELKSNY